MKCKITEEEYNEALDQIDKLLNKKETAANTRQLEYFSKIVCEYEDEYYPIGDEE